MPFTPFHFGPGLLIKGAAPKRFSWSTFVLTQVVIDCETLYNIVEHRYPLHRELHTFLGATLAGLATAAAVVGAKGLIRKDLRDNAELATPAVWLGGLIGGASHPLLDGIMHSDIRPFLPWSAANPLHGAIGLGLLHLACVSAGIAGALLWARR